MPTVTVLPTSAVGSLGAGSTGSTSNVTVANITSANSVAASFSTTKQAYLDMATDLGTYAPARTAVSALTLFVVARVDNLSDGGGTPDINTRSNGSNIGIPSLKSYTSTAFATYSWDLTAYVDTIRTNGLQIEMQDFDWAAGTPTTHYIDQVYLTMTYTTPPSAVNVLFFGENF